jgi:Tripartite tricarboxylate transporter family receptor
MFTKRAVLAAAAGVVAGRVTVLGQTWPTKPIRAIVSFTAGSASDIVPRLVFEQLSGELGQSIVVENRSGAGGTIGVAAVARSEPDGYTILANSSAHTIVPSPIRTRHMIRLATSQRSSRWAACPMCLSSLPPRASGRFRISLRPQRLNPVLLSMPLEALAARLISAPNAFVSAQELRESMFLSGVRRRRSQRR